MDIPNLFRKLTDFEYHQSKEKIYITSGLKVSIEVFKVREVIAIT